MPRPKLTPLIALSLAVRLYEATGECDTRLEKVIAQEAWHACIYARYILKGPFSETEPVIAQYPEQTYLYAMDVLKSPFPEAESVIARDPKWAYAYARDVLKTDKDHARFERIQRRTGLKT